MRDATLTPEQAGVVSAIASAHHALASRGPMAILRRSGLSPNRLTETLVSLHMQGLVEPESDPIIPVPHKPTSYRLTEAGWAASGARPPIWLEEVA